MLTDGFLAYISGVKRYSPRTCTIYSDVLKEFVGFISEDDGSRVTDIETRLTVNTIRDYEFYLSETRKLNERTVSQHLSVLSSFCRWMMGQGRLKSNPVKLVSRPKCSKRLPVFFRKDSMEEYFDTSAPSADMESLELLKNSASALLDGTPHSSSTWKLAAELYEKRLRRMIIRDRKSVV